jgi:hypothetical protein
MPKYKLTCFYCGQTFKNKNEVFRGILGWPLCEDCCYDDICMDFDDQDQIMEEIKTQFNSKLNKFLKYLEKECKVCTECNTFYPKDEFVGEICQGCIDFKIDNEKMNEVEIKDVQ